MKYDGNIDIAVGMSAKTKLWKNKKLNWSELVQRLSKSQITNETYKEYMDASKEDQAKIKDVGGFVGGHLRQGRRKPENLVFRQLITLDIDFGYLEFWEDFCLQYDCAAVIHGTHKYSVDTPRYRLVLPLSRECSSDEYVAVARRVAGSLNIDLFDDTTFEPSRLMYWPSNPRDIEYYFREQEGPWLDVDKVLATYIDWTDSSQWPTSAKLAQNIKANFEKQQDPEEKKGVVGAFCRAFTVTEAIETFLSDIYVPAADGRYTYSKGSTASGVVIYEDKFAYSHHGTDPCGGQLCNAFDLVRLHKFGDLDGSVERGDKAKSYTAMLDFCSKLREVKRVIAEESIAEAKYDFAAPLVAQDEEEDLTWTEDLEVDTKGNYTSTAPNLNTIISKDGRLKGLFKLNLFNNKTYLMRSAPWRLISRPEPVKNVDFAGVRNYVESVYGIAGALKIEDALALEVEKNSYHPVKDYLSALVWDGEKRVDRLLVDFFGATDNVYNREAIRKMLTGAVARIFNPGVKFDLVLTIVGDQGTGKSTLIKKLGLEWFSDTFITVHGKEALEQIQGAWIIEIAELSGLKKADIEAVKHFISKQEDCFRPAYGRTSETYLRQCVFFGTTNNKEFLRDPTGNRRFLPVNVDASAAIKDVFKDLDREYIDQVWAEAVQAFKDKEPLYLSREAEAIAKTEQKKHSETDERKGLIEDYLNRRLPQNWDELGLFERRLFLADGKEGEEVRDYVCVAEVWSECLGKEKESMDRYKTRELNDVLRSMEGWEQSTSTKTFPLYGKQRFFTRLLN